MDTRTSLTPTPALDSTRRLLTALFGPPEERRFAVRFWDGTTDAPGSAGPRFTLVLRRPGALRRMLLPPSELSLAHAYMFDDVDYEGDLIAALDVIQETVAGGTPGRIRRVLPLLFDLPRDPLPPRAAQGSSGRRLRRGRWAGGRGSPARDAAAVRFHYDLGNDFFALWLGERMVYSCGYFPTGTEDLDAAQDAKLEHVCRKLRLQPGERLLDIGCGWGALIQYATESRDIQAVGITLSEEQARVARQRIDAAGLGERCRIEVCDYRSFTDAAGFDKIASIGMIEHVGRKMLADYFGAAYRLLRPGGLMLNHGIISLEAARPRKRSLANWIRRRVLHGGGGFSDTYVWPDVRLVPAAEVIARAEAVGFETRDVESLREHYVWTTRHWLRRLEKHHEEAAALVGEVTYRVWRLYIAAGAHRLASARMGIIQTLLARPDARGRSTLPPTRADLYRDA